MEQEYDSLVKNHVCELVPLLEIVKTIASKWQFAIKKSTEGNVAFCGTS